jgi:Caspase domain
VSDSVGTDGTRIDYRNSAAVVIGTANYIYLPPAPAVANSLDRMHRLLTGPLCGWPAARVSVSLDERAPGNLPDLLVEEFSTARDVALFYYVGHGQPDQDDRLCLGLVESRREPDRRYTTSLSFDAVRHAMRMSKARFKVIVLDCCYSGLAVGGPGTLGPDADISDRIRGSGAFVVAACGPYSRAWYEDEPGNPDACTYFTKRLIEIVEAGCSDGSRVLTLGRLTDELIEDLAAAGKPVPTALARDQASALPFATYRPSPSRPPEPVPVPAMADLPAPIVYVPDPTLPTGDSTVAASFYPDVPVAVWREPEPRQRMMSLLTIGEGLAETDREQARRIFVAAERAAHDMTDSYPRFHLLLSAARHVRRADPGQARRFMGLAAACVEDLADQHVIYDNAVRALRDLQAWLAA